MPEGIPDDPRKRGRNYARLDVTLWFKLDDEILNGRGDATDVLRGAIDKAIEEEPDFKQMFIDHVNEYYGVNIISDITYRVGK